MCLVLSGGLSGQKQFWCCKNVRKGKFLFPVFINTKLAQPSMLWWPVLRSLVSLGFPSPSLILQHIFCAVRQPGAHVLEQKVLGCHFPPWYTSSTLSPPRGTLLEADISHPYVAMPVYDREKILLTGLTELQTFMNTATNSPGKWKINFYTTWQQAVD